MRYSYNIINEDQHIEAIGFYEINGLPGCNQVAVSNHAWIAPHMRNKGHGQKAHEQRLDKAQTLGYDFIMCTVQSTNETQLHILRHNGWFYMTSFFNKETEHPVEIWGKHLTKP